VCVIHFHITRNIEIIADVNLNLVRGVNLPDISAMTAGLTDLKARIANCTLCAADFADTATAHDPRPVVWFCEHARILIAGQAPGARVHASGRPFDDASGDRLRNWLGMSRAAFYDRSNVAIVPMAFCFPGYDAKGADLPPPKRCAARWRRDVMAHLPNIALTLVVGGYAQKWHIKGACSVSETVAGWGQCAPDTFPLPHPSWRNTGWLKRNPWFELDLLPRLRQRVKDLTDDRPDPA
jgi:uracil-DNA glycosylase